MQPRRRGLRPPALGGRARPRGRAARAAGARARPARPLAAGYLPSRKKLKTHLRFANFYEPKDEERALISTSK